MKLTYIAVLMPLALSGCAEKPSEKIAACWNDDTKKTITEMARKIAIDRVETIIKDTSGINDEKRKKINEVTKITLSSFHAQDYVPISGSLNCGALVEFRFTKPDNNLLINETNTSFNIYPGENGPVYAIMRGPIIELVNSAN